MDPTYELISKQILTSDQSSVTFSNIPQTYKDLYLTVSARTTVVDNILLQFNGSISGYSYRILRGSGSSAASLTNTAFGWSGTAVDIGYTTNSTSVFNNCEVYIPNYTASANKSFSTTGAQEDNTTTAYITANACLWSNTSSINSIKLYGYNGSITASSSFYLYGIKNADDGGKGFFGPAMTGGDEVYTTGNGYKVHVFKNSGTLNVTAPGEVEYLVIAGGGGAGVGGGGAGGYRSSVGGENSGGGSQNEKPLYLYSGNYSVLVGAGGNGANATTGTATSGSDSIFSTIISKGGGRGGSDPNNGGATPGSGGSGGAAYASATPGSGTTGQGYAARQGAAETGGSGGGGAGGLGVALTVGLGGGSGGAGVSSSITGSSITRASGGGGGRTSASAVPGGGGAGSVPSGGGATDGQANTGGGGGGETVTPVPGIGKNGGSGIVIIRYRI